MLLSTNYERWIGSNSIGVVYRYSDGSGKLMIFEHVVSPMDVNCADYVQWEGLWWRIAVTKHYKQVQNCRRYAKRNLN